MSQTSFSERFAQKFAARPAFQPTDNLVFKVTGYDKPNEIILGVGLTGESKGQEVRVKISGEGGPKSPDFTSFAIGKGNSTLVKSPIDTILTAQDPKKTGDGIYLTRWVSIVTRDPKNDPAVFGVMARIAVRKNDQGVPEVDARGNIKFSVAAFDPKNEKQAESVDAFKQAILDILGQEPLLPGGSQSVVVSLVSPSYPQDGMAKRLIIKRDSMKQGDAWLPAPAEKVVAEALRQLGGEADLAEMIKAGAKVGVCAQTYVPILGKTAEKLTSEFEKHGSGRSIQLTEIGRSHKGEDGSRKFVGTGAYGYRPMNMTFTRVTNDDGERTGPFILTRAYNADNSFPIPMGAVPSTILPAADIAIRQKADRDAKREAAKNGEAKENKASDPQQAASGPQEKPVDSMANMEPDHDQVYSDPTIDEMIEGAMERAPAGP